MTKEAFTPLGKAAWEKQHGFVIIDHSRKKRNGKKSVWRVLRTKLNVKSKHEKITMLAVSAPNTIYCLISKALSDDFISNEEYSLIFIGVWNVDTNERRP